jgi:signal transduction histidine kinase
MEPLGISVFIVLQLAAAALHGYLGFRFYPDRHQHPTLNNFMWAMLFCALFHLTEALLELFTLLTWENAASIAFFLHLLVEYSLCPFMVSNLMAEYTRLPDRPNVFARFFQKICLHARPLSYVVLVLAFGSLAIRTSSAINGGSFENVSFQSLHADFFVMSLGSLWLLMILSGLRPSSDSYGYNRGPVLWVRSLFVIFILAAVSADEIFELVGVKFTDERIVHFVTVPFALLFSWYRCRFVLVDLVLKQSIYLFTTVAAVIAGTAFIPQLSDSIQVMAIFGLVLVAILVARSINYLLDALWMPKESLRSQFQRQFPIELNHCTSAQQAIAKTEQSLGQLFAAEVVINRQFQGEAAEHISIPEQPALKLELGYIKGIYPWFSAAMAIANGAAIYLHSHLKVIELRAQQHQQELDNHELETLAARAERDAMRAQIRPHFLFNVLNTLHSFVHQQPKEAERIIELLADLMRGVIRNSAEDTYPLQQELELAKTYLTIETIRHGDRLEFSFDVDESFYQHPILPFSLQPLVENAVKYSLDAQLGKASIVVTVRHINQQLVLVVSDNGPGPGASSNGEGLGFALGNIRDRLNKLYGDRGSLVLEAGQQGGTQAILSMPWQDPKGNDDGMEVDACPLAQ